MTDMMVMKGLCGLPGNEVFWLRSERAERLTEEIAWQVCIGRREF